MHIESDDQQLQQNEINPNGQAVQQKQQLPQLYHHFHQSHSHKHHLPHFRHQRRPSRSEEARDAAVLRKWKKSKAILSRQPSTESESSDQSEAVPEIRVVNAAEEPAADDGKPRVQPPPPAIVVGSTLKVSSSPAAGTSASVHNNTHAGLGEPSSGIPEDGNGCVAQQPVKHKARLKLAQILYKEARRRRQKYLEEIQNQQE